MLSTRLILTIWIGAFAGCANSNAPSLTPKSDPVSDQEALQGDWIAISHESSGTSLADDAEYAKYKLAFDGTSVVETGSSETKQATVVLEPTTQPKNITFEYPPHFARWGTYELDDDKLTITWAIHKNIKPNESEYVKFVLKRAN